MWVGRFSIILSWITRPHTVWSPLSTEVVGVGVWGKEILKLHVGIVLCTFGNHFMSVFIEHSLIKTPINEHLQMLKCWAFGHTLVSMINIVCLHCKPKIKVFSVTLGSRATFRKFIILCIYSLIPMFWMRFGVYGSLSGNARISKTDMTLAYST